MRSAYRAATIAAALAGALLAVQPVAAVQPHHPRPVGVPGQWREVFNDEFTHDRGVNHAVWSQTSPSQGECQQGNHGNGQAEWNQGYRNDRTNRRAGLVITDRRQPVHECNDVFTWTGGMLSAKQSFAPGDVIEEKFRFPADTPVGGWDAFWTWCADGGDGCEVDVYEAWPPNSDGNGTVNLSSHLTTRGSLGGGHGPLVTLGDWHVMDAVIGNTEVTWYLDGRKVFDVTGTEEQAPYKLILDNDVCTGSGCPAPAASTNQIAEDVNYVRVWAPARR